MRACRPNRAWSGRALLLASGAILGACQQAEYGFEAPNNVFGTPNPTELEARTNVDRLTQVPIPQVDVLWVIDSSCSMEEEQTALTANFAAFMEFFIGSGLDYHIGVVSMDMNDPTHSGRLRSSGNVRFIDDGTSDPITVFSDMAGLGTSGHHQERGRAAAYTAVEIKRDTDNAGFVRDDAALHMVAISDENDKSLPSPVTKDEFVGYMQSVKWSERMVSFSSIVGPPGGCEDAVEAGTNYLDLTRTLGGVEWSICTEDWASFLAQLGLKASGLRQEYYLSELPIEDTIEVLVHEGDTTLTFFAPDDWVYDASHNSVRFHTFVPEALSVIELQYTVLSSSTDG